LFKQLTADEAVSQEAPGVYTGYKSTAAPKTETKEKPTFEDSRVPVGRKTFTITEPVEGITDTYRYTEYLDGSIGNFKMISEDGKASVNTEIFNALKSFEDIKAVYEKQKGFKVEITQEEDYKSVMNPKMFDKLTTDQQQRVDAERAKTKTTTQETENIKKEREALDKQYVKNSQIAIDDKVVDEYSKIETGYKEESLEKLSPRTLKEALKDLESFLEKTFGWTDVNVFYK
jgi:hypothetical protein